MTRWRESVEEHRDAIESWAASDLPLAGDVRALLDEYESAGRATEVSEPPRP